jgi:aspartyl-tRNA(Asn)/glutamyl-tRNA(Gln) amidotransferase subunit C
MLLNHGSTLQSLPMSPSGAILLFGRHDDPSVPVAHPRSLRLRHAYVFAQERIGTSMQVDEATVRRIARLARIKVTDTEAKGLEKELSGILDWVKQLDEVDTSNVEPMTRVVAQSMKLREDKVTDGEKAADVTKNAPMSEDNFYVVPKVVE